MPLTFLPFILLIVPIAEISLFIVVGGEIGAVWTIGLVLFTAVLGSILLRIEGIKTFSQISTKINSGQIPSEELVAGVMILVAGVLLLTPGFLTDSIGFSLFLPAVRKLIWSFLSSRFQVNPLQPNTNGYSNPTDPDIVDLDPDDFHEEPNESSPWASRLNDRET